MRRSNVTLITIECVYGNSSEFSVTQSNNTNHIQLRTKIPLWHKENLINIAIRRLPSNWKYVLWLDTDIEFQVSDWPLRVIEAFKKYEIIQVYKYAHDLGPQNETVKLLFSFTYAIVENIPISKHHHHLFYAHSGYGWGMTKRAYEHVNGLIDFKILGGADFVMSFSMVGRYLESFNGPSRYLQKTFGHQTEEWQNKVKVFQMKKK